MIKITINKTDSSKEDIKISDEVFKSLNNIFIFLETKDRSKKDFQNFFTEGF